MHHNPKAGYHRKKTAFRFYVRRPNWATKLSSLRQTNADQMVFLTYSLSSADRWVDKILEKMDDADMSCAIVCHSKFREEAKALTDDYHIAVYYHDNLHAKMAWFDNGIVWFGSQNMVKSTNIEFLARIKDKEIATKIRDEFIAPIFADAKTPHLRGRYGFAGGGCPECGESDFVDHQCTDCGYDVGPE